MDAWKLNNNDLFGTYGVYITKGSYNDIMTPPTPRKRLEHEYTDVNGIEVDKVSPLTYESKRYTLKIAIVANTRANFYSRLNAFLAVVAVPGTFTLYVKDLGVTVTLLYEGLKNTGKPHSLKGTNKIVCNYELSVLEPNPTNRIYE